MIPKVVAGTGTIETFSINHQAWYPGLEVPFVVARVSLDGAPGVRLTTNIVGCPVEAVDIGDRVCVTFEQQGEIFYLLVVPNGTTVTAFVLSTSPLGEGQDF